jgi:hypothetical protein
MLLPRRAASRLNKRLKVAITRNQFAAAIDDIFNAVLNNIIKDLNGINLCMLIHHIATSYAQISQPDVNNNLANFNKGIDPSLPLVVYTRKQKCCQVFALNVAVPISKATMVTTGTKHSLACGNMTMAWCKWNRGAIAGHTWPNWKTNWTSAFTKMHDINCMMASKAAFGTNAAEEEHQARQITASLENLDNAWIQKNVTINNLVASNAHLTQALQAMQAAMMHLFPTSQMHASPYQPPLLISTPSEAAVPPTASLAPPPATMVLHPSHWGSVKPAWDKQGYCWSHGQKVKVGHTSATCSSRRAGHQPCATQANTYNARYEFNPGLATGGLRHRSLLHTSDVV